MVFQKNMPFGTHSHFMRASLREEPPDERLTKNRTNSFQEGRKNPYSSKLFGEVILILMLRLRLILVQT